MSEPWVYAPPASWGVATITLAAAEAHHARRALRVGEGDPITVMDGRGTVARCVAARADGKGLVAEIVERHAQSPVRPAVVVYQGAAKGHKLDYLCDRLAELGVAELAVYEGRRSVVHWDEAKRARLAGRWSRVARSAAKQSRNPWIMRTGPPLSWPELVARVRQEALALVLWEKAVIPLRSQLSEAERVALVVGPEGGLEPGEAEELADARGRLVSLGPRILRTEVAPVVAASAVLFRYGAIG